MGALKDLGFVKGHGTGNDFVLIPDLDGTLDLGPGMVARLCDRRMGIGADGVLRVVRSTALGAAELGRLPEGTAGAGWFMDYRNADGSIAEMCGNGLRVFARYLVHAGLAEPGETEIGTRAGLRRARVPRAETGAGSEIAVEMGRAVLPRATGLRVRVGRREWPALGVDMGNPHAVVDVDDLAEAGELREAPEVLPGSAFPDGVNVEFVVRRGPGHLAMRVYERGSAETLSCGTGACAVAVAGSRGEGWSPVPGGAARRQRVDVPGGTLHVTERPDGVVELAGPAVLVAGGALDPGWLAG